MAEIKVSKQQFIKIKKMLKEGKLSDKKIIKENIKLGRHFYPNGSLRDREITARITFDLPIYFRSSAPDEIDEKTAMAKLDDVLMDLGGSNDGSELLMNLLTQPDTIVKFIDGIDDYHPIPNN